MLMDVSECWSANYNQGLHLQIKSILLSVCVAKISVTWLYQTGYFLSGFRITACVAPCFLHPFRQLGDSTEDCRKIGRLSAFITGPCPIVGSGNANIRTEPHRTAPLGGNANISEQSRTVPQRTVAHPSVETRQKTERVCERDNPSLHTAPQPGLLLIGSQRCQYSLLLVYRRFRFLSQSHPLRGGCSSSLSLTAMHSTGPPYSQIN